jgi:hypothetical protein
MFPRKSQFPAIKAPQNERFTKSNNKYLRNIIKNSDNTKHKNNEQ